MMLIPNDVVVYLHRRSVDFRKQVNGLSIIVQESMELDPFNQALYIFINNGRNRIKMLYWHKNGFCLWMKRFERDKFAWPRKEPSNIVRIDGQQLMWLLEGFDIWNRPPHQALAYNAVG